MKITLTVNGEPRELAIDPSTPLLWVLRDELGDQRIRLGGETRADPDQCEESIEQVEDQHGLHDALQPAKVLGRAHREPAPVVSGGAGLHRADPRGSALTLPPRGTIISARS